MAAEQPDRMAVQAATARPLIDATALVRGAGVWTDEGGPQTVLQGGVRPWFGCVSRPAIRAALRQASAALWFRYGLPEVSNGCQKSRESLYGVPPAGLSR